MEKFKFSKKYFNVMDEDEYLDIVDEYDNIIGKDTKENKFKKGLISRNVAIFIRDNEGKFIIVKRSPQKKIFPNCYDLGAYGNVKTDEPYLEAAKREVKEELGIECELIFLDKIYNKMKDKDKTLKFITGIFLGEYTGEVILNDELVELKRMSIQEIEEHVNNNELFTSGFFNDFLAVKEKLQKEIL